VGDLQGRSRSYWAGKLHSAYCMYIYCAVEAVLPPHVAAMICTMYHMYLMSVLLYVCHVVHMNGGIHSHSHIHCHCQSKIDT